MDEATPAPCVRSRSHPARPAPVTGGRSEEPLFTTHSGELACAHRRPRRASRDVATGVLLLALATACGGSPAAPTSPGPTGSGEVSGTVVRVVEGRSPAPA